MAFVYWLRLPEHTNIFNQGYVGVTTQTVDKRYEQHLSSLLLNKNLQLHNALRKYRESVVVETILVGDTEYVYNVEKNLRPECNIGWNCASGGDTSSIVRNPIKRSDEYKNKMRVSQTKKWETRPRSPGSGMNHNSEIWSIADLIYEDRLNGLSGTDICKKYDIDKPSKIHTMVYVHFKNGWNPLDDPHWVEKYKGDINGA